MTEPDSLSKQLLELSSALADVRLPLPLPGAAEQRSATTEIRDQLHDYLLPRLENLEAPLLAVVGGSTGSGKSTLVNSIIRARVSAPGVIRPTTKAPVLVCNPTDADWFSDSRVLPNLIRTRADSVDSRALKIVPSAAQPAGIALLDAPDIDSIDSGNRELANQLLQAADLWLFVTTAARYADAVPWNFLVGAAQRSAAVAVVLDRVPEEAIPDVPAHLQQLMTARGLGASPLFVISEANLDDTGFLPAPLVQPIKDWLDELATEAESRKRIVLKTLAGAITSLPPRINELTAAIADQASALDQLNSDAQRYFDSAAQIISASSADGSLLRGEVLARWQDFVGTGEFMRTVEQKIGWLRDRIVGAIRGAPPEAEKVGGAIEAGLEALIIDQVNTACVATRASWMGQPAGRQLLQHHPGLGTPASEMTTNVQRLVRDWQGHIYNLVASQGMDKRTQARFWALGVNGIGAALIIFIFASTGGLTGAEVGVAGGAAVLAQRLLEAVFGDGAVRKLAAEAKANLAARVQELLDNEHNRFQSAVAAMNLRDPRTQLSAIANELARVDLDG